MRIEIHTTDATSLLNKIKKDIKDGNVKTWAIVKDTADNEYLTHIPDQWFKKALLKPSLGTIPTRLILTVTWFNDSIPNEYTKGLYIGRFTEVLLEHYKNSFTKLETFG